MGNLSRRVLLRSAAGASGLLLPLFGKGAVALPAGADPVPVTRLALPVSPDCLMLRRTKRAMRDLHEPEDRADEWDRLLTGQYAPAATRIVERPVTTWGDCVELAEICWHYLPKVEATPFSSDYTDRLLADARFFPSGAYLARHAIIALVEGVLTLGDGERYDPKIGGRHHG